MKMIAAVLLMVSALQDKPVPPMPAQISPVKSDIVFENGAFYIKTGSFTVPMSGGGASGCLGEASQGKITFHDPASQRILETDKPTTTEKKQ